MLLCGEFKRARRRKNEALEKVARLLTPEEAEAEDIAYWKSLTLQERLDHMMRLVYERTPPDQRRIQRAYQLIVFPEGSDAGVIVRQG